MKIIGPYDYWDSAGVSFGRDDSVVLIKDRPFPETVLATREYERPYFVASIIGQRVDPAFALKNPVPGSLKKHSRPKEIGLVIVAGECYGFMAGNVNGERITYWSFDSLLAEYPDVAEGYAKKKNLRIMSEFFEDASRFLSFDPLEFLIENKAAYALMMIDIADPRYRLFNTLKLNPSGLGSLGFASIIDPYQMYQKVMMFQAGVLTSEPDMVQLSDETRILKAGFDLKDSFRNTKGRMK